MFMGFLVKHEGDDPKVWFLRMDKADILAFITTDFINSQSDYVLQKDELTCGFGIYDVLAETTDEIFVSTKNKRGVIKKKNKNHHDPQLGRLIGGRKATVEEIPWIVFITIHYKYNPVTEEFQEKTHCAGSILAPDWVITAYHCFIDEKRRQLKDMNIHVTYGTDKAPHLYTENEEKPKVAAGKGVYVFHYPKKKWGVALIRLETNIDIRPNSTRSKAICVDFRANKDWLRLPCVVGGYSERHFSFK